MHTVKHSATIKEYLYIYILCIFGYLSRKCIPATIIVMYVFEFLTKWHKL